MCLRLASCGLVPIDFPASAAMQRKHFLCTATEQAGKPGNEASKPLHVHVRVCPCTQDTTPSRQLTTTLYLYYVKAEYTSSTCTCKECACMKVLLVFNQCRPNLLAMHERLFQNVNGHKRDNCYKYVNHSQCSHITGTCRPQFPFAYTAFHNLWVKFHGSISICENFLLYGKSFASVVMTKPSATLTGYFIHVIRFRNGWQKSGGFSGKHRSTKQFGLTTVVVHQQYQQCSWCMRSRDTHSISVPGQPGPPPATCRSLLV